MGAWHGAYEGNEVPLYRYDASSAIDDVTILTNENGGVRAYLHASAHATPERLLTLRNTLNQRGWHTVPTTYEGQQTLEIRGFKKPERLLNVLQQEGVSVGNPLVQSRPNDKRTSSQQLESGTLRFAGMTYIAGDMAYMIYTVQKYLHEHVKHNKTTNFFNKVDIVGGIGYGLGSLSLAFYGSRDQSQNTIQSASEKIEAYMRKEAYAHVEESGVKSASAEPKRGFWGGIDHAIAKYPSETLNSIYVGVGAALSSAAIYRALKEHHLGNIKDRNTEIIDIGLGAVTATSAIAGLAIKEKKREEGEEKRGGLLGVWDWIQEKPLRATGYGFMIATLFHAGATIKKWNQGDELVRKSAVWRGIFVAANIVAEIFMAVSSKGHGTGVKPDESVDQTVIAGVADTILRQPIEQRDNLIHQVSGYMASRDVLGGKADEIATELKKQVEALEKNPWVKLGAGLRHKPPTPAADVAATNAARDPVEPPEGKPTTRIADASHVAQLSTAPEALLTAN